ncbi:MAG: hypothetical protein PHE17_20530 [Thiothrix sp.]|uniref:hypothetical protein n=1 Tax=Thiothrix sp. TaxID=1032 RepID=UPI00261CB581|nr:hypothetical protein [Thiothrix sp.]MDD5395418.1 hypothetical protein [Thiothrix sp.]
MPISTEDEPVDVYPSAVEKQMQRFYHSLNERDRRRYAAVEAIRLGHGGQDYISRLLGCDPKTIRHGVAELESEDGLHTVGQRKKGADANG